MMNITIRDTGEVEVDGQVMREMYDPDSYQDRYVDALKQDWAEMDEKITDEQCEDLIDGDIEISYY